MFGLSSPLHWLIVLLIVVLIFGTKKLRNIGGDLGGAVKDFKNAMNGNQESAIEAEAPPKSITQKSSEVVKKRAPAKKNTTTQKVASKSTVSKSKKG